MYSSNLSLIPALDRGWWSTPISCRFTPQKVTRYPLPRRLGGLQDLPERVRKISPSPGFEPRTIHPVASRYNDYLTYPYTRKTS
jgi:hypothetical protein